MCATQDIYLYFYQGWQQRRKKIKIIIIKVERETRSWLVSGYYYYLFKGKRNFKKTQKQWHEQWHEKKLSNEGKKKLW